MKDFNGINSQITRQSGFSMIEVLISIVIASIGLLGLAGMQVTGLKNNQSAYQNSQATVLAYDLADRMRDNDIELVDDTETITWYLTSFMTLTDANKQPDCGVTSGCSIDLLAENDLYEWNAALAEALPGAVATITVMDEVTCLGEDPSAEDNIYTITICWDDNNLDPDDDPGFQMSFRTIERAP